MRCKYSFTSFEPILRSYRPSGIFEKVLPREILALADNISQASIRNGYLLFFPTFTAKLECHG